MGNWRRPRYSWFAIALYVGTAGLNLVSVIHHFNLDKLTIVLLFVVLIFNQINIDAWRRVAHDWQNLSAENKALTDAYRGLLDAVFRHTQP